MNGMNKVIIVGTLGGDPKTFVSKEGRNFTAFSLATNRTWKTPEGEKGNRTDWHRITVWGKKAQICQDHLKKGYPVCIEGHLSTYEAVDEEGKKKWNTSITADEINFLPHPNRQQPQ